MAAVGSIVESSRRLSVSSRPFCRNAAGWVAAFLSIVRNAENACMGERATDGRLACSQCLRRSVNPGFVGFSGALA